MRNAGAFHRRRAFPLGLMAMCWSALVDSTALHTAEAPRPPAASPIAPAELAALWEAHRTEIATAEIRFQCFNAAIDNPQNTPERVAALLAEHDLVGHPERLEAFLLALWGRPFHTPRPWEDMSIVVAGRRRRFEDAWATFVTDGETEAVLTPKNRQLDLMPVGKSAVHYYDLDDIRWIPSARVDAGAWELVQFAGEEAVFNVPPHPDRSQIAIQTSVDAASGFVTHTITRRPDGEPVTERFQRGFDVQSSGIVCPRLRVDLQYAAGVVRTARVILVQSARFNEAVDDAVFRLPVAPGLRIIDNRGTEKTAYVATESVPDALALPVYFTHSPAQPAVRMPESEPADRRWTWLIVAHAIALATGWLLLRRRRRALLTRHH